MIRDLRPFAAATLLCCGGWLPIATAPSRAAESPPSATATIQMAEVRLPQSRQWTMRATGSDREYTIYVAVPEGPAPEGGYATIYVLDANTMFLTAVEAVRSYTRRRDAGPETHVIVVGIGYPEGVDIPSARTFDLTPEVYEPRNRHPSGGADAFLDFIVNELRPRIAREFPVDPYRQALMGHSYGGLFAIGTLTSRPEAFQTYVGMSSSFWFGNHDLSQRVEAFAQARTAGAQPTRVLLTVGEFEQRPRPEEWWRDPKRAADAAKDLEWRGQSTHALEAARQLSQAPGILVDYQEIAGMDHGTVIPAAIGLGIDFILNGPREVPAVPTGEEYLQLGAEGRYRLRMQVRALPDLHRVPWLNGLKASLGKDLDSATRTKLHEERQQMDIQYGSRPRAVNVD
ncbi:MAG TPA: alpha/beta hydrolase-fold protein [Xanthomonadaceae bacterium]|nr:alpha/beta hydrolase-fold protein [Xanthomonadaceae bacterium]